MIVIRSEITLHPLLLSRKWFSWLPFQAAAPFSSSSLIQPTTMLLSLCFFSISARRDALGCGCNCSLPRHHSSSRFASLVCRDIILPLGLLLLLCLDREICQAITVHCFHIPALLHFVASRTSFSKTKTVEHLSQLD
ncbi:hypothetical protein VIGAN_06096400 [Vigna angularis var. angularis]|uniref:Uncharacterized protein n=1 Tax=Vigna angularis var. angularis TaxID=157739 RepID=A0A0S3SAN9_PHAAN|nr:hypothetical protein VIGAN_06096400 [Vigna angularis var. angularis]